MKKLLRIVCLVLIMSTVLAGCKQDPDLKVFNNWITDNGFSPSLTQKSMLFMISNYTYLGKSLTPDNQYMSEFDEGESVGSGFWGLNSNVTTKDGFVHSNLYFYVRKNLDNLVYPGGVKIGDSFDECMSKLGLADKKQNVQGIEIGTKTCELSLNGNILIYKESYDWMRDNGDISAVTRSVKLKFTSDQLSEVAVIITQRYAE